MLSQTLIRTSGLAGRQLFASQRRTVVAGPPLRRMPFPQKLMIGGSMIVISFLAVPAYIMYNLKYYNKSAYATPEEEED